MTINQSNVALYMLAMVSMLWCALVGDALAQDDAYYAGLRDQLQNEYGLTGGTWLIGGTEEATLSSAFTPDGVAQEIITVDDQPFTRWYKVHLGFQAQEFELGGVAVLNYTNTYTLDDLPQSTFHLDYEGRDPGAPWRAEAQARIEEHRKDLSFLQRSGGGVILSWR